MKSGNTSKKAKPITPELRAKLLANAPDEVVYDPDNPPTTPEYWDNAFVTHSREELMEKLAERRRGKGKKPAKVSTTLRLPADVLARWKATGRGWQTRMGEVLAKAVPRR